MSSQKSEDRIRLTQKPKLLQCNEANDLDPGCDRCYRMYPDGLYCPTWKVVNVKIEPNTNDERKILEDYLYF